MKYDPEVIVERAEDLRRKATEVQIVGTILYLLVGLAVGLVASLLISLLPPKSFWRDLRLRAHLALLHVETERHLSKIARRPCLR